MDLYSQVDAFALFNEINRRVVLTKCTAAPIQPQRAYKSCYLCTCTVTAHDKSDVLKEKLNFFSIGLWLSIT